MRARTADLEGYVERDGVSLFFEVFGEGEPTLLLLPAWSIVHSRHWKAQIPYLARHFRVVTFDGRGNGRSSRPSGADSYLDTEFAADALAVLDHLGVERAVLVGLFLEGPTVRTDPGGPPPRTRPRDRRYWHHRCLTSMI